MIQMIISINLEASLPLCIYKVTKFHLIQLTLLLLAMYLLSLNFMFLNKSFKIQGILKEKKCMSETVTNEITTNQTSR